MILLESAKQLMKLSPNEKIVMLTQLLTSLQWIVTKFPPPYNVRLTSEQVLSLLQVISKMLLFAMLLMVKVLHDPLLLQLIA